MNELKGVIYIDGANAMGKSFLAQTIKNRYPNTKIIHCTYRFGKIMWYYHLAALRHCLRHVEQGGLAILDRNWISEEIYGHHFRNGTSIPHQGRIVQKLFLKHGAVGVLCIGPVNLAEQQVQQHRTTSYHSPVFVTKPVEIANRYWDLWYGKMLIETPIGYVETLMTQGGLANRLDWLKYEINVEGTAINEFIDNIAEMLEFNRATQYDRALQFNVRNIAGHLRTAKWIVIGDTVNHDNWTKCWPFMIHANSTLFMAEAMNSLKCREEDFMWTNANCSEMHVGQLLKLKPSLKLLALGGKAHKFAQHYGASLVTVPHPSYGRRFMGFLPWTKVLGEALAA